MISLILRDLYPLIFSPSTQMGLELLNLCILFLKFELLKGGYREGPTVSRQVFLPWLLRSFVHVWTTVSIHASVFCLFFHNCFDGHTIIFPGMCRQHDYFSHAILTSTMSLERQPIYVTNTSPLRISDPMIRKHPLPSLFSSCRWLLDSLI